jgi:hypothetical protein
MLLSSTELRRHKMTSKGEKGTPFEYVEVTEQKRLNEARDKNIPWKKWGVMAQMTREQVAGS